MTLKSSVQRALNECTLPFLETDAISAKLVTELLEESGRVTLVCTLGFPLNGAGSQIEAALKQAVMSVDGVHACEITLKQKIGSHTTQSGVKPLKGVKNCISIASGKGGVGKSTVTSNLAVALSQAGARVGILDADIYGPSQPTMLGLSGRPDSTDGKHIHPKLSHGVQCMSVGFLVEAEAPIIWRGPMVSSALQQMLRDTLWDDLDYLLIDLPPGTGDIQLTLSQKIPLSGSVVVTTPQDIALIDVTRAIGMFNKVKVPVLGVIENMSMHICSECGHSEAIFGKGGAETLFDKYGVECLARIPLAKSIREQADSGQPIVAAAPVGEYAKCYHDAALNLAAKLSLQSRSYANKFPEIVIKSD